MRRIFFVALVVILVALPLSATVPVSAQGHKALILSSLERYVPTGYSDQIQSFLTAAGYQVTFVKDTSVTVTLLLTQLNNYDLVIWRTNVYGWNHVTYWYVGELANQATSQAYASDFTAGWIDDTNGILGVSLDFFNNHFGPGSLGNVKLAILVSSMSNGMANIWLQAGVQAVVDYYGTFSLTFGLIDYVTSLVVRYLSEGNSVKDSVWKTVLRFLTLTPSDPLDQSYLPPVWWVGSGALTIP